MTAPSKRSPEPNVPVDRFAETLPSPLPLLSQMDAAADDHETKLSEIVATLLDQVQTGKRLDLEQAAAMHPDFADDLREIWGMVMVAEAVGKDSSAQESAPSDPSNSSSGSWRLTLPIRFGDYELLEEVGRGGMGIVYRARQISLSREVAVKMILRDRLASSEDRERFYAEAAATARLQHAGIVPVYEVGEWDGRPFFSMQFIRGKTLLQRLREGVIPQRESAQIILQIARAIDFAHRNGILHRDLKPSNIMLDDNGKARVTDFGLAKEWGGQDQLTRTGAVIGTPTYMAPEQAAGRTRDLGPASDVYSLGTVLYHCLTGQPPFRADSPVELALKVLEQDPPPPREIDPRVDRDLEMIVVRCLQKPPDLRYATADKLADDLQAFLRDEPVSARSGQFAQVIARWLRETHHAQILENWGLLWMWHSLVLLIACLLTEWLQWSGTTTRGSYAALWSVGLGMWAAVFWALRRRMGPVTFVERQIAHVWGASLIAIGLLSPLEWWMDLKPLTLSPVLGIVSGMVFFIKAGILSGAFYAQALALFLTAGIMAAVPMYAHIIFGVVSATCFFIPGLKYYRQRIRTDDERLADANGRSYI